MTKRRRADGLLAEGAELTLKAAGVSEERPRQTRGTLDEPPKAR